MSNKKKIKSESIGEFKIDNNIKFWLYSLKNDSWKCLDNLYKNEKYCYYVPTIESVNIKKNDIIFMYQQHKYPKLNGFVGICNASGKFKKNDSKIKFFNDINLGRFYTDTISMDKFDNPIRISLLEKSLLKHAPEFKSYNTFKIKYISKQNTILTEISRTIGLALLKILIKMSESIPENTSDFIESSGESDNCSDSSDPSESSDESSDDSDDDAIYVVKGHIPILINPCKSFAWNDDNDIILHAFKKHYNTCDKCEKIDNNDYQFSPFLERGEISFDELKKEDTIDKYLEYYHNLKNYTFELCNDDKHKDHIKIYRINNRSHIYHRSILIVW